MTLTFYCSTSYKSPDGFRTKPKKTGQCEIKPYCKTLKNLRIQRWPLDIFQSNIILSLNLLWQHFCKFSKFNISLAIVLVFLLQKSQSQYRPARSVMPLGEMCWDIRQRPTCQGWERSHSGPSVVQGYGQSAHMTSNFAEKLFLSEPLHPLVQRRAWAFWSPDRNKIEA